MSVFKSEQVPERSKSDLCAIYYLEIEPPVDSITNEQSSPRRVLKQAESILVYQSKSLLGSGSQCLLFLVTIAIHVLNNMI